MISVNDDHEVVQIKLNGETPGLNDLTFLLLTIAHKTKDPPVLEAFEFKRKSHTTGGRKALPQISGIPFYPGHSLFYVAGKG